MPSAKVHVSAATDRARNVISAGSTNGRSLTSDLTLTSSQVTPYSRLINQLRNDERLMKELTLGKRVGLYRFYGDLGTGNFSQVKLGVHQLTNERVAVKVINKAKLDQKTQRMLAREIANMDRVHHPNIIRLYEVLETLSKIHLVMEHAPGGELFHKITTEGRMSEQRARPLVAQLVSAVQHMHNNNMIHRDIKAENVFFSRPDVVKLGDFGFSTLVNAPEQHLTTFCGSPPYAAPELFRDDYYTGAAVDAWALGILVHFMVAGAMPFRATTVTALKRQILSGAFPEPEGVSAQCLSLIRGLLRLQPAERWTLREVADCPWLAGQTLPSPSRPFSLTAAVPGRTVEDMDKLETATRARLVKLGLDADALEAHWERGGRSPVTGIYRITMHRMMRAEDGEVNETDSPRRRVGTPTDSRPDSRDSRSVSPGVVSVKNDKSKACTIL
ncbi:serine/threonine-protein kinase NIM1-like isoform X2 [Amphibalanus amphitrite]|nr:serine/threonine-protein kinase NIM1-like isoform X2 [Amphibalanus amphitrite]